MALHEHLPLTPLSERWVGLFGWFGVVLVTLWFIAASVLGGAFVLSEDLPRWGRHALDAARLPLVSRRVVALPLAALALAMFVKLWIFDRLAASDVGVAELRAAWESVLPLRWAHQRWQLGRGVGSVWTALRYAVRVNRVGDFVVAALWLRTTALQICYLAARCMLHAMVTLGRVGSVSAATGWVSLCTAVVDDFGVFFVVNAAIFSIEQAPVPVTLGGRMRGLLDQYPRRAWIWPLGKLARADVRSWSRFKLQICEAIPTIAVIWVCARTIVALPYSLLVGFLHGESFTIFDAYRCISLRPLGRLWFTNLDDNSWRWPTVLKPWGVHRLL